LLRAVRFAPHFVRVDHARFELEAFEFARDKERRSAALQGDRCAGCESIMAGLDEGLRSDNSCAKG
jgi:hypothetical protein